MNRSIYGVLAAVLTALLLVSGCAARGTQAGPNSPGVQQLTAQMSEFKFDPANVKVKSNQPVQVTVRNGGTTVHDWTVEGMDQQVHVVAQPGQTATVQFTPTKPGTFRVVCTQPGHEQAGMVGQLIVQ